MPKEKTRYVRLNYATQTDTVMQDTEEKDKDGNPVAYDLWDAIISIKNDIAEIKKSL
jgi:hypothetical protein